MLAQASPIASEFCFSREAAPHSVGACLSRPSPPLDDRDARTQLGASEVSDAARYHRATALNVRTQLIHVTDVEPLEGFRLRLSFSDGTERELDLEAGLWGPVFAPLKEDPDLFRQVRVDVDLGSRASEAGPDETSRLPVDTVIPAP